MFFKVLVKEERQKIPNKSERLTKGVTKLGNPKTVEERESHICKGLQKKRTAIKKSSFCALVEKRLQE